MDTGTTMDYITKEYDDIIRVFPAQKDPAILFIDYALWFPYKNKEVVCAGFDFVHDRDVFSDTDMREYSKRFANGETYSQKHGSILNRSYANNPYLTMRRKNGRKVTKYGFPVFGSIKELNSIVGIVLYAGTTKAYMAAYLPVSLALTSDNNAVSLRFRVNGLFNDDSSYDLPVCISATYHCIDSNGKLWAEHYTTLENASENKDHEHSFTLVETAYPNIIGLLPMIPVKSMPVKSIYLL